jgi:ABC-type nickel/cobalt efflux system permease component RcnA
VLPEQLYPWLTLASGVMVVSVGIAVLRRRVRRHDHHHHHHEHRRSLLAMGASAGLIPCPSALVVLLGAVAQHRIGLGLVLIVAFSAGLAATLTGIGIAVVHAGKVLARLPVPGRVVAALPALSAALIVVVGIALTAQAVPQIA